MSSSLQDKISEAIKDVKSSSSSRATNSETSSYTVVCQHVPSLNPTAVLDEDFSFYDSDKINRIAAIASSVLAIALFSFQHVNPVNGVTLLHAMEKDSVALPIALCNGKPTMIEFYADWCESCKAMAPTMREMELSYGDKVNFITLDGTNSRNSALVDRFRVDGIPHVAFIAKDTELKTSLVGAAPKTIIENDIKALISNKKELPYVGMDPFEGDSHYIVSDIKQRFCKINNNE